MDVLKKIEKLCLERDWTVYKLALESGLSQSTLANMFSRGTLPSLSTLKAICEAFGMTLSQFFQEDEVCNGLTREKTLLVDRYRRMPADTKCCLWKYPQN